MKQKLLFLLALAFVSISAMGQVTFTAIGGSDFDADEGSKLAFDGNINTKWCKRGNDEVEELLATRTDESAQQIVGALRKARLASDEAYQDAVVLINAMAVVGTEKSLTPLINYLNANIKRYKEQVMTRGKKDEPEDL